MIRTRAAPRLAVAAVSAAAALSAWWLAAATAAGAAPLEEGAPVPELTFVDIADTPGSTKPRPGWVQVITFGDRDSSEEMKAWMRAAQIETSRKHPELRIAYLGFADLTAVPGLFSGLASGFVRSSYEESNEEMKVAYADAGVSLGPTSVVFQLVPDWDGDYLEAFGLENAESYHVWIAADGRVVASIDRSTPAPAEVYARAFERIAANPPPGLREPTGEAK